MTTISVPLPPHMIEFIEGEVRKGNYENKAGVIRSALKAFAEECAIAEVLKAEREVKQGKVFYGDLRDIIKKFPND